MHREVVEGDAEPCRSLAGTGEEPAEVRGRFLGLLDEAADRKTVARDTSRAVQGIRKTVRRVRAGGEQHGAIEERSDPGAAGGDVRIPQLRLAATGGIPALVEIHEQVDAAAPPPPPRVRQRIDVEKR